MKIKQQINKQIGELLEKPMDRKAFLKHAGFGILLVAGFGTLLKLFPGLPGSQAAQPKPQPMAYGGMAYGGKKTS